MANPKVYSLHCGYRIYLDPEDGFHWAHGGYSETLAELEAEIEDYCHEEAAHYADIDIPPDTPSLPARWPF